MTTCQWCGRRFKRPNQRGPIPLYCRPAHRQAAYQNRLRHDPHHAARRLRAAGWTVTPPEDP